jgi:hypothetical protein
MSTAPSRQGYLTNCLFSVKYRLNFWPDVEWGLEKHSQFSYIWSSHKISQAPDGHRTGEACPRVYVTYVAH